MHLARRRALPALLLALVALPAGCSKNSSTGSAPSPGPSMPSVREVRAVVATLHPALTVPGGIAPYRIVALSNAINEPTRSVYVEEGDRVRAGQVLADLDVDDLEASLVAAERTARADEARTDQTRFSAALSFAQAPEQVRQARAQLTQAEATLQEAARNLTRDATLAAQGYVPQQNLDEQNVVVRNDRAAVNSAQAQLQSALATQEFTGNGTSGLQAATIAESREQAAAQDATAEQLRREIARAHIVTPVDGYVINRNLNPGEYPAGRQIFTIEANATVFAILTASAVQAYQIRRGDEVFVTRAGMPGGRFRGRVVAVLDAATAGSTNFTVKVAVANPRQELRAGTPVEATVALRPVRGVVVPSSAFVDETRSRVVAIVGGRARARHVVEVATDGANSVVTGLRAGVPIVRDGSTDVSDGERVATGR